MLIPFLSWVCCGTDIVPDIVTMGKPMGNGHPIAAVVTTPEIAASMGKGGYQYFNTVSSSAVNQMGITQ